MKNGICMMLAVAVLLFTACTAAKTPAFDYREGDFTADTEVLWGEVRLACRVTWASGCPVDITYSAPAALEGVRLVREASGWIMLHGSHRTFFEEESDLEGLLSPVLLLNAGRENGTFLSRQKTENGWVTEVEDTSLGGNVTFTMDAEGFPRVIAGGGKTLRVLTYTLGQSDPKE